MPLNIHVFRIYSKRNTVIKKNVTVLGLQNSLSYRIQNSKFYNFLDKVHAIIETDIF